MELKKKKFKRSEVEQLLISLTNEYENKIGELKDINAELTAEKQNLLAQNGMQTKKSPSMCLCTRTSPYLFGCFVNAARAAVY